MLFNSLQFAVFLPVVFLIYWAIPNKFRWFLLLVASYFFYMSWNPKYVVLILFTTAISYTAAILIEKQAKKANKKIILAVAAVLCLGVLFFFKYFNFASSSVSVILSIFKIKWNPVVINILLPVGISFYTFQTLSYVIDVYRGETEAERHFGKYATFVSFFPQLVAGPIERTNNLLPQIKEEHHFDYDSASYGLKQMAWGYFKKIVIADTIAKYSGLVFENPLYYKGFALVLAAVLFSIQIYCDFSGYSDIAIGAAKLFGINLMTNFRSPYFAQSIREFWSRWHISLSTWFRDYIYIPLGGNRVGKIRHAANLMITFLVSGLWHGASWTFVVWGGLHGLAQIVENLLFPQKNNSSKGIIKYVRILAVFVFCTIAWILFASNTMSDVVYYLAHLFDGIIHPIAYLRDGFKDIGFTVINLLFLVISILILIVFDYFLIKKDVIDFISQKRPVIRWGIYIVFLLWLIFNIAVTNDAEFIYFQF